MGFFGTYLYDGIRWLECRPDQHRDLAEPWLMVDIHDSDIATVVYRPAGPGTGIAYLGDTPARISRIRRPRRLPTWSAKRRDWSLDGNRYEEDVDQLDDAEIFVEVKIARFLEALDLPVPGELSRRADIGSHPCG